ncbi:hypothetical protein GOP47_0006569 [Adiantum capillus-veneris]|uniref:Uncharacterized protein n=1 Tax=Adiantum capillus-veneris TaxID=13818 RepID=A0A9D4V3B6_ADICA|nr:hypothetical protein GOP47_0006569 [Adiantum capillus-veneris]
MGSRQPSSLRQAWRRKGQRAESPRCFLLRLKRLSPFLTRHHASSSSIRKASLSSAPTTTTASATVPTACCSAGTTPSPTAFSSPIYV